MILRVIQVVTYNYIYKREYEAIYHPSSFSLYSVPDFIINNPKAKQLYRKGQKVMSVVLNLLLLAHKAHRSTRPLLSRLPCLSGC